MVRIQEAKTVFPLATVYLVTEIAGQSQATVKAKQHDLQLFLTFYQTLYKHDQPDEWFVSVTKAFVKALQQERLAQASLVASMPRCGTSPAGCIGSSLPSPSWGVPPMGEAASGMSGVLWRRESLTNAPLAHEGRRYKGEAWRCRSCRLSAVRGPLVILGIIPRDDGHTLRLHHIWA